MCALSLRVLHEVGGTHTQIIFEMACNRAQRSCQRAGSRDLRCNAGLHEGKSAVASFVQRMARFIGPTTSTICSAKRKTNIFRQTFERVFGWPCRRGASLRGKTCPGAKQRSCCRGRDNHRANHGRAAWRHFYCGGCEREKLEDLKLLL